ncbi:hypothetical protein JHK84_041410 [Glycine max]|nr:hypothetical protein JHK84_041410 [Glycine max]
MTRRCSHCTNNGHNSRTCPSRGGGGVKLFGVRLTDGSIIKKSASMGNLNLSSSSSAAAAHLQFRSSPSSSNLPAASSPNPSSPCSDPPQGYLSDDPAHVSTFANRRGDRKKDQPSVPEEQVLLPPPENSQPCNEKSQPSLNLSLKSEFEPMETTSQENVQQTNEPMMGSNRLTPMAPHGCFPAYLPVPFPVWPSTWVHPFEEVKGGETCHHQIHKPIPVIPKEPVNVDELVGMSHLSIGEAQVRDREPSPLSIKLLGEPSRQSAFHANVPVGSSDLNNGKDNAIQAV